MDAAAGVTDMRLSFCTTCGSCRLRDVIKELQKLFAEKTLMPNTCGICLKHVESNENSLSCVSNDFELSSRKSVESGSKESRERTKYGDDGDGDDGASCLPRNDNQTCNISKLPQNQIISSEITNLVKQEGDDGDTIDDDDDGYDNDDVGFDIEPPDDGDDEPDVDSKEKPNKEMSSKRSESSSTIPRPEQCVTKNIVKLKKDQGRQRSMDHTRLKGQSRATRLTTGTVEVKSYAVASEKSLTEDGDSDVSTADFTVDYDEDEDDASNSDAEMMNGVKELRKMEEIPEAERAVVTEELPNTCDRKYAAEELLEQMVPANDSSSLIECKVCLEKFQHLGQFAKHVSIHTGKDPIDKPYRCPECATDFTLKHFSKHLQSKHRNTRYKCTYRKCTYTFNHLATFRGHLDVHKGIRQYFCTVCGAGFLQKNYLVYHRSNHADDVLTCSFCRKTFNNISKLKVHEKRVHLDRERYKCDKCSYTCSINARMRDHICKERPPQHQCWKCGQICESETELNNHLLIGTCNTDDKDGDEADFEIDIAEITRNIDARLVGLMDKPRNKRSPFRCRFCPSKEFTNAACFLNHMKKAHPGIDCPVVDAYCCDHCGRTFKQGNKIAEHVTIHTDYRPYKCDFEKCSKTFKSTYALTEHKRIHTIRKKYICSKCGACLVSASKLKDHEKAVHLKLQTYKCSYCAKGFTFKAKKDYHEKMRHLNVRKFVCEVCGKSYKEKKELERHNYTHTGEKPYACIHCNYRCVRRDYLKKHLMTHTGEKPHECNVCHRRFPFRTSLVMHQKKEHGGVSMTTHTPVDSSFLHEGGGHDEGVSAGDFMQVHF